MTPEEATHTLERIYRRLRDGGDHPAARLAVFDEAAELRGREVAEAGWDDHDGDAWAVTAAGNALAMAAGLLSQGDLDRAEMELRTFEETRISLLAKHPRWFLAEAR